MKRVNFYFRLLLSIVCGLIIHVNLFANNTDSLELYTPYTKISVSPGKSVSYSIEVINKGTTTRNEAISVAGMPYKWDYTLTAGGYNISRLAVLPGEKKKVDLKIEVPYQVRKGNYAFSVKTGENVSLPLTIRVSSAGSSESELSCDQKNMEGTTKSNFSFKAVLKNKTASKQQYALMAQAPRGWTVAIKPNYKQATSTEVEANGTKDITYEIKPSKTAKAGSYKIPVKAVAGSTSAELELEVVITGTYELNFSTPTGLLSAKATAGEEKKVELLVNNAGSSNLENIVLSASKPRSWEATFEPDTISSLEPGQTKTVFATIKADKKAIPGDYVTKITARNPEVNETLSFRVMVKTPMLMGWIGVFIIVAAIAVVIYLFKKYGRR
ncbi:NEW3 domain-containing protein [uncultured Draconibacterium sp.]|uniref:COG1470 family protein n=1 Tax=uncultured Draconibacterium sp. TaxID=1573823 RepID=UPI0025D40AA0|nr:NEW3 domain-containing protein [uncultured Draconibacterium sp.]